MGVGKKSCHKTQFFWYYLHFKDVEKSCQYTHHHQQTWNPHHYCSNVSKSLHQPKRWPPTLQQHIVVLVQIMSKWSCYIHAGVQGRTHAIRHATISEHKPCMLIFPKAHHLPKECSIVLHHDQPSMSKNDFCHTLWKEQREISRKIFI